MPHIRANYNTREEIINCSDRLTFDGIYENVWVNSDILAGRECLMFVVGNMIGGDNKFDKGMPPENYCTLSQLNDLAEEGHIMGWHTWNHPDLTRLSLDEARKEMTCPWQAEDFAYPYGLFNQDLMKLAEELGYKRAWSVTQGNDHPYSLRREYI